MLTLELDTENGLIEWLNSDMVQPFVAMFSLKALQLARNTRNTHTKKLFMKYPYAYPYAFTTVSEITV